MAAIKSVLKWNIRDSFSFCAGIRWKSTLVHQLHICEPGGCVYVETSVGDGAGGVEDVKPFIGGGVTKTDGMGNEQISQAAQVKDFRKRHN